MSHSFTTAETISFTVTHARRLASKVVTDLKRMQRYYGQPSDLAIEQYEEELTLLMKYKYLNKVTFGFKKDGKWIEPTLKYSAAELTSSAKDDDPGRIYAYADVDGAIFGSCVSYSSLWCALSSEEQERFESTLPIARVRAEYPGANGVFSSDHMYSSGGYSLSRFSLVGERR